MGRILRSNPGSEQGAEDEDRDQHDADRRQRVVAGEAGERDGGGGH